MNRAALTAGKATENWFREFAKTYGVLSDVEFPLERVVKLLDEKLPFKLSHARPHLSSKFPFANEWIDDILSQTGRVGGTPQEKAGLATLLLDTAMATDAIVVLRDNQTKQQVIAVDVTCNPTLEERKLNIIRGQRDERDFPGFNQNQNLPVARKDLGIHKHLILVLNPKQPPQPEQLLNALYALANSPSKTASINLWSALTEVSQTHQAKTNQIQTPQVLWRNYSQEASTDSHIQRQIAITHKALRDGHGKQQLAAILACDPFVRKIQRDQGLQKARNHIQLVIRSVTIKASQTQDSQRSAQRDAERNQGPQL